MPAIYLLRWLSKVRLAWRRASLKSPEGIRYGDQEIDAPSANKLGFCNRDSMDYETARNLLVLQGNPDASDTEALLIRLKQGRPPVPGQVTTLLLALKIVFEALRETDILERQLVYALHRLAIDSRQQFEIGQAQGVEWPPLLSEDLTRIGQAVRSIFSGRWEGKGKR